MDEKYDYRAFLAKFQDCISDQDQHRLRFLVNNAIPKKVRKDPTLGGTLDLLESLFNRGKINTQDFRHLIRAFHEIGCHAAVTRLKEHQPQGNGTDTEVILYEDVEDASSPTGVIPLKGLKPAKDISASSSKHNRKKASKESTAPENGKIHSYLSNIRQSRFTVFQIILLICNIIGIISLIILIVMVVKKQKVILARMGEVHGSRSGGEYFDHAKECSLTFNEQLIEITGQRTTDGLDYIQFRYSNDQSKEHGQRSPASNTSVEYRLKLKSGEYINGVKVHIGSRKVSNSDGSDETYSVIGLHFYTNRNGWGVLFGSNAGKEIKEYFPNYKLGYIRGQAEEYIDAIQFIWYSETARTASAALPSYLRI